MRKNKDNPSGITLDDDPNIWPSGDDDNSGDDRVDGLGGDDILDGGEGNDSLFGGSGDDVLLGGDGNDFLMGDTGDDFIDGGNGVDILNHNPGQPVLVDLDPDANSDTSDGFVLFLGDGDRAGETDQVTNVENVNGTSENDILAGSNDSNEIDAGRGDDVLIGRDGGDDLQGASGSDILVGGFADYDASGQITNVTGDGADDVLNGGRGKGGDRFVFGSNDGDDTIEDFGNGDVIDLSFTGVTDLASLTITNQNGDAVMQGISGTTITLIGVAADSLSESDFIFPGGV